MNGETFEWPKYWPKKKLSYFQSWLTNMNKKGFSNWNLPSEFKFWTWLKVF